MRLLSRKPKIDRKVWTHVYTGPENRWGLKPDTPCRIIGNRAGGRQIQTNDGSVYVVGRAQVELYVEPA